MGKVIAQSFDSFRAEVLQELEDTKRYRNFSVCVKEFEKLEGLDKFAESLLPLLNACWKLNKGIVFTAKKIDSLTHASMMLGMLRVAEDNLTRQKRKRGQNV